MTKNKYKITLKSGKEYTVISERTYDFGYDSSLREPIFQVGSYESSFTCKASDFESVQLLEKIEV